MNKKKCQHFLCEKNKYSFLLKQGKLYKTKTNLYFHTNRNWHVQANGQNLIKFEKGKIMIFIEDDHVTANGHYCSKFLCDRGILFFGGTNCEYNFEELS